MAALAVNCIRINRNTAVVGTDALKHMVQGLNDSLGSFYMDSAFSFFASVGFVRSNYYSKLLLTPCIDNRVLVNKIFMIFYLMRCTCNYLNLFWEKRRTSYLCTRFDELQWWQMEGQ